MVISICSLCQQPVVHPVHGDDGAVYCCHACREVTLLIREDPFPAQFATAPAGPAAQVTFNIGGLWCASCAWLVEERLKRTEGVVHARVNFLERKARITFDESRIAVPRLVRRIRSFGYRADTSPHSDEEDRLFTRMLVGGLLAMHIMVVSLIMYVREWMGLSSPDVAWLEHFFFAMQFVLSIPLSLVLGLPILRAGINSLLRGLPNVQTLVAIGSIAALGLSVRNLLLKTGHVYFDTAAMLFFLLTVGRWLEIKAHQAGQNAIQSLSKALPHEAARILSGTEEPVPIESLKTGDRVRIRPGGYIPADGIIASGMGELDESLLTGEPQPNPRHAAEQVFAGTLNLDGTFDFIVTKTGGDTRIGQIGSLLDELVWQRSPAERLADRFAATMVYVAIGLAGLTFAAHYAISGLEAALMNALSVLLIACPCALGIATPLTLWQAVSRAAENGILLRSSGLFEKLGKIRHIFFDKTGTLTELPHKVHNIFVQPGVKRETFMEFVTALEQFSTHPFGTAVMQYDKKNAHTRAVVSDFRTVPGAGLAGLVNGVDVRIGSSRLMQDSGLKIPGESAKTAAAEINAGRIAIFAGWEGQVHGIIIIGEHLRAETRQVLQELKSLGITPSILTGDTAQGGARWQKILDIPVRAEMLPEEKLAVIQGNAVQSMMVGDGINDGPALAAAGIGVAMLHGTDTARSAAEITLLEDDLRALPWLIRLSSASGKKLRQNLTWAVIYNVIGIGLAMAGLLQPVLAAAAMVLSSFFVTRNALGLRNFPSWKNSPRNDESAERKSGENRHNAKTGKQFAS